MGDHGGGSGSGTHAAAGSPRTLSKSHLLVMYGFVSGKGKKFFDDNLKGKSERARRAAVIKLDEKTARDYSNQERFEIADQQWGFTGYPGKSIRYHLIFETSAENVEEVYFDILERTRQGFGFPFHLKITDYFAASENSAFFGNSQQRVGLQQDRVQQFLANIGKFVKELFQMVRELRILDERLAMYNAAGGVGSKYCTGSDGAYVFANHKPSSAADVSLKSVFTDLVEGGTKNPQSVFGLAQQVGFTLLPDLFFNEYVRAPNEVDAAVDKLEYNKAVKAVLKRKLFQYLTWKEKTYTELVSRRKFNIKYLRQHWTIIQMYMSWIKPYLRNIQRLTMNAEMLESAEIISAFESATIEVEFLAYRSAEEFGGFHPVICANLQFRSRPDMNARKEYQQGPIHVGRTDMTLRAYAWSPEQLKAYRDMKRREEVELLGLLDVQLKDIMDSLGDEFEEYLKEAGEEIIKEVEEKKDKKKEATMLDPFLSIFGGIKEIGGAFIPKFGDKGDHGHGHGSPGKAMGTAVFGTFQTYHTFKKSRRMITW